MKLAETYASALYDASQTKTDTELESFFANFIGLLKSKNHYRLLPQILIQMSALEGQKTANKTTLVVANGALVSGIEKELETYKETFGSEFEIKEDPNIVGGYIVKNKTALIDNSYRSRLLGMYRKLIA